MIKKVIEGVEYVNPSGFADILDVTTQNVIKWLTTKRIAGIMVGSRYWIPLNELSRIRKPVGLSI
jgi:hypothetical protein